MKKPKFLELKVYKNKRTGQATVPISKKEAKKMGKKIPESVKVTW